MKMPMSDLLPPVLVAMALAVAVSVFISETRAFRNAVSGWAARDLDSRTALAAAHLREPLATGDFRAIHAFGASCAADGVRLTVFSAPGGVVFDSVARAKDQEQSIYAEKLCGEFKVRLGLPVARVLAPYRRARLGFLLAAAVGGAGVMLIVLFTLRQRARMRELARERDAQRRLVEELKKVEAFRRDFIADVSHEIKTPLTGILGAIDLLSDGESGALGERALPASRESGACGARPRGLTDEMRRKLLGMIKVDGERLNVLAQSILSLARLERGDAGDVLSRTRVDLSSLVDEVTERLAPQATMKGVSLVVHALDPCEVECDAQLIESAISNLVVNAVKHSGSEYVWISVSREAGRARSPSAPDSHSGGKACITVEDHGVGIPEEHREKVFDRFHRVDGSRSAETGGAGLGLAIVRRIAQLHGGDVTLEPATPSGCRFILTLPA